MQFISLLVAHCIQLRYPYIQWHKSHQGHDQVDHGPGQVDPDGSLQLWALPAQVGHAQHRRSDGEPGGEPNVVHELDDVASKGKVEKAGFVKYEYQKYNRIIIETIINTTLANRKEIFSR